LHIKRENKTFWVGWYRALPEFALLLISSWIKFWSVTVSTVRWRDTWTFFSASEYHVALAICDKA
jgi:hypothetical protein